MGNRERRTTSYHAAYGRRTSRRGLDDTVRVRQGPRRGYNAAQKRRRNMKVFYICIFSAVVIAAVVIFCGLIMKVSEVVVTGSSRYSQEEILNACPIKPEDNMLAADTDAAARAIEESLPYIGNAEITRQFPSRMLVTVSQAEVLGAIEQDGKYIIVSKDYKVLEITDAYEAGQALLKGITLISPEPGKTMSFRNEEVGKVLVSLQNSIDTNEIAQVTEIDLTDLSAIKVVYDGRVTMNLGAPDNLEYKIAFGINIILNEDGTGIESDAVGTLDLSRAADTDRAVFSPAESGSEPSSGESSATGGGDDAASGDISSGSAEGSEASSEAGATSDSGDGSAEG